MTIATALTGAELISLVEANKHLSKREQAKLAGYVGQLSNGSEQVFYTSFYGALLDAKNRAAGFTEKDTDPAVSIKNLMRGRLANFFTVEVHDDGYVSLITFGGDDLNEDERLDLIDWFRGLLDEEGHLQPSSYYTAELSERTDELSISVEHWVLQPAETFSV